MLHRKIGRSLNVLKPLVGLVSLLYTPAAAEGLWHTTVQLTTNLPYLWFFLAGCGGYLLLWAALLRRFSITWFSTFEHELTHALFALLTFNKVTALKATLRKGGHIEYEGTAHWLIHCGPYFFPTLNVLLLIPMAFVPDEALPWMYAGQGLAMGYHLVSTYHETHRNQKDLQLAGYVFCVAFLPFANLLSLSILLNGLEHGWPGIESVFVNLVNADLKPDPLIAACWHQLIGWVHTVVTG